MPLPRSRRGSGRESSASPPPTHRRGRGSSAVPPPTRRPDRGSSAVPPPTRRPDLACSFFDDTLRPGHDCRGQRTPCEVKAVGRGAYYVQMPFSYSPQHPGFSSRPCEVQAAGGGAYYVQMPYSYSPQHPGFSSRPCKEKHVAEPASAQTLQQLDVLSLKDPCHTTTMEGLSTATASSPSPHYTIEASQTSERRLSSSPIWKRRDFEWGITFHTIKDLRGYFHTFPQVGGPFRSKDEVNKAIDCYLTDNRDLTMGIGLSEVDALIQKNRYYPDGSKRLKAGQPIDKKRDTNYQLVEALLYKYNDHHNLIGDLAYELKDVLEPKYWEEENDRLYFHINFTAKTKGSDGFDTGSDNLFFAEVTCGRGDDGYVVNCCCMVKPFDNGRCVGCGTAMKHPSDRSAYTGGLMNASCNRPFGSFSAKATWVYEEDSDEEVERLRLMFEGGRATPRVPLKA